METKFRAFSKNEKKMYKVFSFCDAFVKVKVLNNISTEKAPINLFEPLMQFTGIKDKNGVKIWEGDIIKTSRGDWGIIVWNAPFFEVTVSEDQSCMYSREWFDTVEVIGNIYENSELLK